MRQTRFLLALLLAASALGCSGDQVTGPVEDGTLLTEKANPSQTPPGRSMRGGAKLVAHLNGENEVPVGDPDGGGRIHLSFNPGLERICYGLRFVDIAPPVAMHIHRGAEGENGPVVVPLSVGPPFHPRGCVEAPRELIKEILKNPGNFYINVHNPEFPGGAIRGQLVKPGRRARP